MFFSWCFYWGVLFTYSPEVYFFKQADKVMFMIYAGCQGAVGFLTSFVFVCGLVGFSFFSFYSKSELKLELELEKGCDSEFEWVLNQDQVIQLIALA